MDLAMALAMGAIDDGLNVKTMDLAMALAMGAIDDELEGNGLGDGLG